MTGRRTGLAHKALRHAERMMPRHRRDWARAMAAELEHLPERDRLPFALGCLSSSYRARFADPATLLAGGRGAIIFGLCAFTALCIHTAPNIDAADPSRLVSALGMICALAAVAFVRWGLPRLPVIAAGGLASAMLAIVAIAGPDVLVSEAMSTSRFHRAILIEQIVGWAALFAFAHILMTIEKRRVAHV